MPTPQPPSPPTLAVTAAHQITECRHVALAPRGTVPLVAKPSFGSLDGTGFTEELAPSLSLPFRLWRTPPVTPGEEKPNFSCAGEEEEERMRAESFKSKLPRIRFAAGFESSKLHRSTDLQLIPIPEVRPLQASIPHSWKLHCSIAEARPARRLIGARPADNGFLAQSSRRCASGISLCCVF